MTNTNTTIAELEARLSAIESDLTARVMTAEGRIASAEVAVHTAIADIKVKVAGLMVEGDGGHTSDVMTLSQVKTWIDDNAIPSMTISDTGLHLVRYALAEIGIPDCDVLTIDDGSLAIERIANFANVWSFNKTGLKYVLIEGFGEWSGEKRDRLGHWQMVYGGTVRIITVECADTVAPEASAAADSATSPCTCWKCRHGSAPTIAAGETVAVWLRNHAAQFARMLHREFIDADMIACCEAANGNGLYRIRDTDFWRWSEALCPICAATSSSWRRSKATAARNPSNELVEMIDEGYFDEPTSRRSPASSAS